MFKVYLPYPKTEISQRFGLNKIDAYAKKGLKGHTSYDWSVPHGTPIPNCTENAYCYSIINKDNKDLMKFRAAYFITEGEGYCYEVVYGHMDKVLAEVGKTYQPGDVIGTVGNTGEVYRNGKFVTREQKKAGSTAGSHLHGPQLRVLTKSKVRDMKLRVLYDENGIFKRDGYYYHILDYKNGYNGCVSLAPFSTETLASTYSANKEPEEVILDTLGQAVEIIGELPVEQRAGPLRAVQRVLESFWAYLQGKK